eukprot:403361485
MSSQNQHKLGISSKSANQLAITDYQPQIVQHQLKPQLQQFSASIVTIFPNQPSSQSIPVLHSRSNQSNISANHSGATTS